MTRADATRAAGFAVSDAEIEAVLSRHEVERIGTDAARYKAEVDRQLKKLARGVPRGEAGWLDEHGRRTTAQVDAGYSRVWSAISLAEQVLSSKTTWFEWRDRAILARTPARKHLHALFLVRALEALQPSSVLEVGSGYGFNLLLLSMQFPGITLSGVELTGQGVAATAALAQDADTGRLLAPFAASPVGQQPSLPSGAVQQGSAESLPLPSKSVDVACTVLALEQMDAIRDAALRELARVARRHVVMIEPFRDWNAEGLRREYIRSHAYFDAALDDLHAYGLRPVVATADFPNKITFHVGLVIAEVA